MSMPSTMQVGRISSQPRAQFSIEFVSGLLGKASRVRALRSSAPQVRLSASADGPRYKVSAGQDTDAMMKRLYDAWLL